MIVFCYGTRPEAIKIGPVVAELRNLLCGPGGNSSEVNCLRSPVQIVCTGQHWDLLAGTPAETDLKDAISLGVPSSGHAFRWIADVGPALTATLESLKPTVVVVQGDTASAMAGAKAAHFLDIPIAHIEAGIRSGNLEEPWPEEGFRREITKLATWHYTPTSTTYANLIAEGIPAAQIRLTGNTVVSALARYTDAKPRPPMNHIVLTMHRREWLQWVDLPAFLGEVAETCLDHPKLTIIWPVHPAVKAKWPEEFSQPDNLEIWPPQYYLGMIELLARARGLATDSGGLVEEAATLGIPTTILRRCNDRPEAVEAGIAKQFAPTQLREAINWLAYDWLNKRPGIIGFPPRAPTSTFGDPTAASQIAHELTRLTT